MEEKKKFYQKKWFLWLWLVIFPPVGLALLWTVHRSVEKRVKIILSAVFTCWFFIALAVDGSDHSNAEDVQTEVVAQAGAADVEQGETGADAADVKQAETGVDAKGAQQTGVSVQAADEKQTDIDATKAGTDKDKGKSLEKNESTDESGKSDKQEDVGQDDKTPEKDKKLKKKKVKRKKSKQEKEDLLKNEIREAIIDVVGEDNLDTFNYVPDKKFSLIKFKGKASFTHNLTVKAMYSNMFNILKAIQSKINTNVDFNVMYPMKDIYGKVSEEKVIAATFTYDTIQKINFENAIYDNIPYMADEWWNHQNVTITE